VPDKRQAHHTQEPPHQQHQEEEEDQTEEQEQSQDQEELQQHQQQQRPAKFARGAQKLAQSPAPLAAAFVDEEPFGGMGGSIFDGGWSMCPTRGARMFF